MFRRVLSPALVFALVLLAIPFGDARANAAPTELYFTEYIEGSSNNKALEIYNGTGAPVNLGTAGYNVQMYFNGSASALVTINLIGTVAKGDVFVLAQASASATILAQADQTSTASWYNGDDAVVLRRGTTIIDVIGQIGFDPGTEWGSGLTSTADNTLRRKFSVSAGDPNGSNVFDPVAEWDGFVVDTFADLGRYSSGDTAPAIASTSPAAGATSVARSASIHVTFSEPVTANDGWASITCATSGAHAATITGSGAVYTIDPASDFAAGEMCTVTVFASQVTDLDTNDPPDNMAGDVSWSFTTENVDQCGDPATLISEIQGPGVTTTMTGTAVTVEGVVVGDYQGSGQFRGYFVQEEDRDADGDPATSEGIFVFNTSLPVAPGDRVRITGTAGEFEDLTQLSNVSRRLICPAGGPVTPTTITLPVASMSTFERYEGMLVSFAQTLTATETFTLGRFGEVRLSANGRLYNPTAVTTPGDAAVAHADLNKRSSFILDDGDSRQNIDPTIHPVGGLSAANTLRSGYTVEALTGVFDYRFGAYRLQPVGPVAFTAANPRPATPAAVGGNTKVASFNVLNFFNGDGQGGGFPTARGANNAFELERQKAKEISALSAMNADIVGLMEIENDSGPYSALAELVAGLNAEMGAGTYAYIDTGVIGTDQIKVALIYKPAAVMPSGDYALLTTSVDPRFIDTRNRPALAQTFIRKDSAGKFTVVVNHLKSKGSACAGDPDLGDGQGNCNGTRTLAAAALADWLATDPTGSGDADVLIMGDLNAYTFEDPITTLEAAGYTNLARRYHDLKAYSYVFDGQAGYLDHALATSTLADQATGVVDWHINADEPIVLDYNVEFKTANQVNTFYDAGPFRSSDHDPVIIGFHLTGDLGSLCEITQAVVTNRGVATSLCQKLEAAAAAAARGVSGAADNLLDAYVNEISAIRGKRVSDADADLLIAIVQTL